MFATLDGKREQKVQEAILVNECNLKKAKLFLHFLVVCYLNLDKTTHVL